MPKITQARALARREEIVDACAQLYEVKPFKEITLGEIGANTSFTRTSIYNYFRTKEEIFLALLEREYAAWAADLDALDAPDAASFPAAFAALLERRRRMLKLLSMNLYDMEAGSSLEALVQFKRAYLSSMRAMERCLRRHFPRCTEADAQQFIYAFYPFLFGVWPYTEATQKQRKAMEIAGMPHRSFSVGEIAGALVEKLVRPFL